MINLSHISSEGSDLLYWRVLLAKKIKDALEHYAGIARDFLDVHVEDGIIILNGMISSISQKEEADNIVNLLTQGNIAVENNLKVDTEYLGAEDFF